MRVALVALSGLLTVQPARPTQESNRTVFRAERVVVYVDVLVERGERVVTDLQEDDFEIFDDGDPQTVVLVDRARAPFELVVALDTSSSMAGARLDYLKDATRAVIDALSPEDAAALVTFSHHVSLRHESTTEHTALLSLLDSLQAYGETAWRDALFTALATTGRFGQRRVVMLFTDGDDTYSWLADDAILSVAEESNAIVYGVTSPAARVPVGTPRDLESRRALLENHSRRVRLLRQIARRTGGKLLEMDATEDLRETFLAILHESDARYLLGFSPTRPIRPGWHELEVKVKKTGRGVDVRARRGYYFEPG